LAYRSGDWWEIEMATALIKMHTATSRAVKGGPRALIPDAVPTAYQVMTVTTVQTSTVVGAENGFWFIKAVAGALKLRFNATALTGDYTEHLSEGESIDRAAAEGQTLTVLEG
jgi:hypothetical protein